MVNKLSALARDDTIKYARTELNNARIQLNKARAALTNFRNDHQVIDPTRDVQGQISCLTAIADTSASADRL